MKKELEGKLIEYSLCKKAAEFLRERYCGDTVFVRDMMEIDEDNTYRITHEPEELLKAFNGISIKKMQNEPAKFESFTKIVSHRVVSVTSKIVYVLRKLYNTGKVTVNSVFEGMTDKSERHPLAFTATTRAVWSNTASTCGRRWYGC